MSHVLRMGSMIFALAATAAGVVIAAAVWLSVKIEVYGGGSLYCNTLPEGGLLTENPAPRAELSWFPFGNRCVYPAADGGTIATDPGWSDTIVLGIAIALFLSGVIAFGLTRVGAARATQGSR
ncbi:hypothetical protein [Plantibacter sp. YIM 135347]|uniref:hypothetical protein n=1 Tax=Plantibacter sp. YIM 135347 TaxID=3423919 RepID=UPI003D340480